MSDLATLPLGLPETATFEEWSDLGTKLCAGARKLNWLIGDWLIAGVTVHGQKARDEANRIFRSDVERFDPILKTCRRFPEGKRHDLSFSHHQAVISIADDAEAEALLVAAETAQPRMTVAALRAKVRVEHHQQQALIEDDDPEDTAMRAIVHAWNRAPMPARTSFIELAQESHMGVIDL